MAGNQKKKIVFLPYDFDTAIGITNEGTLAFSYNLEDIDHTASGADIFNGQQSVLWKNLREMFAVELKSMYQRLRSQGKLSYELVERMFEEHQAKWPEAVFNEDAWYKYLAPLEEDGNANYLSMLQGSKSAQRKWWLYNRFRYLDSKYNAGDSQTDVITIRGYAKANISITPYADVYATVKYGSYLVQSRAARGQATTVVCPLDNVNDTEIYIYSASQLASVGDLSGFMAGYADFSMAVKLQGLILGRSNEGLQEESAQWYDNGNLQALYLGNNTLLQTIDVRNCSGLGTGDQTTVDISGCSTVRTVLFEGTSITGITLPDGGVIETLHLPGTVTILKILNQGLISDFSCPDLSNITTLWLENVSSVVPDLEILAEMSAGSRVRLWGFSWEVDDADELSALLTMLGSMRGLDQNGNNTAQAQLYGTVHCPVVSQWLLDAAEESYPDLAITYDAINLTVFYYNYDGTLLGFEVVASGQDAVNPPSPARAPSNTTVYTFAGWASTQGGEADEDILEGISEDKSVYAVYSEETRYYTVRFFNGYTLLYTQQVPYGNYATYYDSSTGSSIPAYTGAGDPIDYPFTGWAPAVDNITEDTDTYARFTYSPSYARKFLNDALTGYTDELGITDIGAYAFAGSSALTRISLPSMVFSGGEVPEGCFAGLQNLESLTFGASVFPAVTNIGKHAFRSLSKRKSAARITMSFPRAEEIGQYAFSGMCRCELSFERVTTVNAYAFNECRVEYLALPSLVSVDSFLFRFSELRAIQTLLLSSVVSTSNPLNILSGYGTNTLEAADLGFTSRLDTAFRSYTVLETLVLRNLSLVTFSGSSVYASGIFAQNSPLGQGTGSIYVPSSLVEQYKAADGWSSYAGLFKAIEGSVYERGNSSPS